MAKAKTRAKSSDAEATPETPSDKNKPIQIVRITEANGTTTIRTYGAHVDVDLPSPEDAQVLARNAAEVAKATGKPVEIVT